MMYTACSWKARVFMALVQIALVLAGCTSPDIERLQERREVGKLIQVLQDGDRDVALRAEAARALGEIGDPEAVRSLGHVFYETESEQLKERCLQAMVQIGDQRAAGRLLDGIWSERVGSDASLYDEQAVALAMDGLVEMGDVAVAEIGQRYMSRSLSEERCTRIVTILQTIGGRDAFRLVASLADSESRENQDIAQDALLSMAEEDEASEDYLLAFLSGEDPVLRYAAALGLGQSGSPEALEALLKALREDGDARVRGAAAWALGRSGSAEALEALGRALREDDDAQVRIQAAILVADSGEPQAVESLVTALRVEEEFHVSAIIIQLLGEIGDEEAIEGLIVTFRDEFDLHPSLHYTAAAALEENSERAVGPLLDAVLDVENKYHGTAGEVIADTMVRIGGADIVEPLVEGLRDVDKEASVRSRIAYMLGELGDERAVPVLVSALKPDVGPRGQAASALRKVYKNDPERLLPLLKDRETAAIYIALIEIGSSGTEEALVTALQDYGDKGMAETYLNSGNELLEEAARAWAEAHGYSIGSMPTGGGRTKWGTE